MPDQTPETRPTEAAEIALAAVLRPYRADWKRREKLSKYIEQCLRAAKRGDFFAVAELVGRREVAAVSGDPGLAGAAGQIARLGVWAQTAITAYREDFLADLAAEARAASLFLQIDFPRFTSRKGITGDIRFEERKTTVGGATLKSVDPRRIVAAIKKLDRRLYGRAFNPQTFIDKIYDSYQAIADDGDLVHMSEIYLQVVIDRQSAAFYKDMAKGRFRGYPRDEFAVDFWRYFCSDVQQTTSGHFLTWRPGRTSAMWMIDRDGERRQIATLSFQRRR